MPRGKASAPGRKEYDEKISRTLGCLLIALAASASLAACRDAVTGEGGNKGLSPTTVGVTATSGVSGANPKGTVSFHFGGGTGRAGTASELPLGARQHGDHRLRRGLLQRASFPDGPFPTFWVTGLVRIVDNGPGPGDTFEFVELETGTDEDLPPPPSGDPLPGPTECSTFPPGQSGPPSSPMDRASGSTTRCRSQPRRISARGGRRGRGGRGGRGVGVVPGGGGFRGAGPSGGRRRAVSPSGGYGPVEEETGGWRDFRGSRTRDSARGVREPRPLDERPRSRRAVGVGDSVHRLPRLGERHA